MSEIVKTKPKALDTPHKNLKTMNSSTFVVKPIKKIVITEIVDEKIITFLGLLIFGVFVRVS